MNEHEVEELAAVVRAEWADGSARDSVETTDVGGEPEPPDDTGETWFRAGWPLGAPAPVLQSSTARIRFISAKSLGATLVCCFSLDEDPQQYLMCFDLAPVPPGGLNILAGRVGVEIGKLASSRDWDRTQRGVLPVSSSLTIVLPSTSWGGSRSGK
ncbi:hypothetical protein [Pseudonocardia acaciae]|uniref:hypothetical protein n=1 Tax=Pseudonocardia acaciae TaxID=551276 RepID=UPI0012EDDAAE|nr:hypothetical protein [Pseudonocardia acaciae]